MTTDTGAAAAPRSSNPSSPYCQRWSAGRHSWRHVSEGGFDASQFDVRPIPEALARSIVAKHHYAGTLPATRLSWGLLTRDDRLVDDSTPLSDGLGLVGVACLSVPMSASVLSNVFPRLEPFAESLELGRLVLTDPVPANAESWFLTRVWRQAAAAGLRGIVSFADPLPRQRVITRTLPNGTASDVVETVSPGHVGSCYQGAGAIACGRSTARTLIYLPRHGTVLSERTLSKIRLQESGSAAAERNLVTLGATPRRTSQDPRTWLRSALDDVGAIRLRHPGNFRYAWPIGTRRERRRSTIALPSTPNPKADTHRLPVPLAAPSRSASS
ncbi:hypothetical protein [Microbacterium flavum]|uniref:Mom family adenine methylcarbamoylation protein n=1 Tax=Microbacterium flavum TaxID=415216 RepID=UPI0024AE1160|nr:hypothetical protein [Microbacterium flavum]